jgi:hypothetical protein
LLSGNYYIRAIRQRFFQISCYIFRQQILQKLYSVYILQDPILFFLCFTAPLLTGSGMMDYIVVIFGLPVFVHAFLLWPVDGATMSVSYRRTQSERMGNWIGRRQVISILK